MLRKILLTFFLTVNAYAANLTVTDIRSRLVLNADIYIMDASGKKIISGPERTNLWKSEITTSQNVFSGGWSSRFEAGLIALEQKWEVLDDGTIKATISEFATEDKGKMKGLLEKKEYILNNFEPIVWKVKNIKNINFIVRFFPSLREVSSPTSVTNLPIGGSSMTISDNQGYLWANDVEISGNYIGVTSHRGTLVISYLPFAGAKEMGAAEGNQIILHPDQKFEITLRSLTSFLPAGMIARVYGIYLPEKKSSGLHSLHSFNSNKEEKILETLKKR